jgi:hypothetical protein
MNKEWKLSEDIVYSRPMGFSTEAEMNDYCARRDAENKREDSVSEKKIVVPDGMLEAFWAEFSGGVRGPDSHRRTVDGLNAALQWLSENPIMPTDEQSKEMYDTVSDSDGMFHSWRGVTALVVDWQRHMFLAPEPHIPEDIKDLMFHRPVVENGFTMTGNERIAEAYRRGKKAGS